MKSWAQNGFNLLPDATTLASARAAKAVASLLLHYLRPPPPPFDLPFEAPLRQPGGIVRLSWELGRHNQSPASARIPPRTSLPREPLLEISPFSIIAGPVDTLRPAPTRKSRISTLLDNCVATEDDFESASGPKSVSTIFLSHIFMSGCHISMCRVAISRSRFKVQYIFLAELT